MGSFVANRSYFENRDVKSVKAFKENGKWFLDITLEYEDSHRKEEMHIPKVELDFDNATICQEDFGTYVRYAHTFIEFASSRFNLRKDDNGCLYTIKKTDKPEKLTLEDIEERLGYKVELVSRKGD